MKNNGNILGSIGSWQIIALETGDFRLDGGAMMGSVPKILWEKTNPPDELNRIDLAMRCLLLDNGEYRILIESGMGDKLDPSFAERFHVKQPIHPLKEKLNEHGYKIEDITHVILTHLHFDHSGGATTYDSDRNLVPTFNNAIYYISESNWKTGINPSPRDSASYLDKNYLPLQNTDQLELVPENTEIIKGISTMVVNGHTQGQQLIKVESGTDTVVFCADLIPLRSHLQLPWIMGYDLNAALSLKEKKKFLQDAAEENWWLWFYHDPNTVAVQINYGAKYFDVVEEIQRSS